MHWMHGVLHAWRRRRAAQERECYRLRRLWLESERLRAELSHLEREIRSIEYSRLTQKQKALLESAIRVRCRKVEGEMLVRQNEITASGHLMRIW